MADHSKNISNSVSVFGLGPTTKWGQANAPYTMTWGTSKWGSDESSAPIDQNSIPVVFEKVIQNSQAITNAVSTQADFQVAITSTATPSFEATIETLTDGSGAWRYVYVSDTINADERDFATWTSGTDGAVSFTTVSTPSTVWT